MKNVITFGKLIGLLLLLFCLPLLLLLLSILFENSNLLTYIQKCTRIELTRLVTGTIVLVVGPTVRCVKSLNVP